MAESISGRVRLPKGFDSQTESVVEGTLIIQQGALTFPDGTSFTSSIDTAQFVTTSSFNTFTATYNTGSFTGSFTGSLFGTASFAATASFVSSNFQYEIHVSQVDGNDTTGNGDLLKPVATIGKALLLVSASVASTDRRTIIVHPGTYIENITINTTNTYFFSTGVLGANCLISGSVTISAATRMSGIKMTNLIVSSSNPIYINNCAVDKQMTVSGSGYLEVQNTSLQCTSGIQVVGPASSGVIFENCSLYPLTVNNASAAVYVISCNQAITPTLTAGALTITRSTISSQTSGATSTALTTAAGSVLVLESCNVYNSLLTSHAAITANGFYSIKNVIYNRSASTLASLSGTGGPLATVSQFQYINADNINSTQGLTVTGSLNITGSQTITGLLTVTQNISASSFTGSFRGSFIGSLQGTSSWAENALTASLAPSYLPITSTSSMLSPYVLNSQTSSITVLSSSYATTSSFIGVINLTALPTVVAFTAPVASITSGGTAAETTLTTLTVPAGIFKSGDQILLTLWGSRTTGGPTGVNSTLTTRITDISGSTVFANATGNRHHNYTLTGRCLSDTSIIWWQNSVTTAATTTTVPSLSSNGFTLNFSVTRDLNTSEFTLYNAICRKYN